MKADELEVWVKRVGLMVLIVVLFALASAQAADGCGSVTGKLERIAAPTLRPEANSTPLEVVHYVLDNIPHQPKPEQSVKPYLALHCEAVSGLLLGQAMRAYHGPACAEGKSGTALQ